MSNITSNKLPPENSNEGREKVNLNPTPHEEMRSHDEPDLTPALPRSPRPASSASGTAASSDCSCEKCVPSAEGTEGSAEKSGIFQNFFSKLIAPKNMSATNDKKRKKKVRQKHRRNKSEQQTRFEDALSSGDDVFPIAASTGSILLSRLDRDKQTDDGKGHVNPASLSESKLNTLI